MSYSRKRTRTTNFRLRSRVLATALRTALGHSALKTRVNALVALQRTAPHVLRAALRPGHEASLLVLLAPDRLQLSEHRIDIEVVALLFGRLEFRLLARGGFRGRQQGGAAIGLVGRLLLGRALHLEVEFDLRAQA